MVNNAKVIKPDIKASNGVIHVIDSVILPPAATKVVEQQDPLQSQKKLRRLPIKLKRQPRRPSLRLRRERQALRASLQLLDYCLWLSLHAGGGTKQRGAKN
jgi:hypothetical protein